jgi:hypothetical protein
MVMGPGDLSIVLQSSFRMYLVLTNVLHCPQIEDEVDDVNKREFEKLENTLQEKERDSQDT